MTGRHVKMRACKNPLCMPNIFFFFFFLTPPFQVTCPISTDHSRHTGVRENTRAREPRGGNAPTTHVGHLPYPLFFPLLLTLLPNATPQISCTRRRKRHSPHSKGFCALPFVQARVADTPHSNTGMYPPPLFHPLSQHPQA